MNIFLFCVVKKNNAQLRLQETIFLRTLFYHQYNIKAYGSLYKEFSKINAR